MKKTGSRKQCQFKICGEIKDTLKFTLSEVAGNLAGYEVYLLSGLIHIGSIHYSKVTRKYSYHPLNDKFIYYTDSMLEAIAQVTKGSNKAIKDNKRMTNKAVKILETKKIRNKKPD